MAESKETVKVADPSKKKKKKNPPDRPQPTWMFPADEENPVFNPKVISEEQKRKEDEERVQAIKFLRYKSVSAPMEAAPPSQLLSLVGAFLTSYGLNSTSRLYTTELSARKKLDDWDVELGKEFDKGMPGLVKIYKDWHKEWQAKKELEETSSEEDEDATMKSAKKTQKKRLLSDGKAKAKPDEPSSSGSSGSSSEDGNSDVEMEDAPAASKVAQKAEASSPSGTSSSSFDSDADDEKDDSASKAISAKPTVNGLVKNPKRKASSNESASSSSESESDSSSSGEGGAPPAKKTKVNSKKKEVVASASLPTPAPATKNKKKTKPQAKVSSSSSSSADSDSDEAPASKPLAASSSDDSSLSSESDPPPAKTAMPTAKQEITAAVEARKTSTDSSATLEGGSPKKTSASSASSSATSHSSSSDYDDSDKPAKKSKKRMKSAVPTTPLTQEMKRKRSVSNVEIQTPNSAKIPKKQNTPFSRIPQDIKLDPKLASNAYVPYGYAQKAHEDLIVTKGKGFTKEKNKKKRGSYRGGPIDISGGKGIKFDN